MKWLTKKYKPKEGDKRRVRKFAFFPKTCGPYTVWLESYESHQVYKEMVYGATLPRFCVEWVEFERNYLELYP